jgi:ADP-ribosylglycohydrolase
VNSVSDRKEITEDGYANTTIGEWVEQGLESKDMESVAVIGEFGQACHTAGAFPGVIHLITKYENDLREALIQAAMAGGDNAARGMMEGMVLGAYSGETQLPEKFVSGLRKEKEIKNLLDELG